MSSKRPPVRSMGTSDTADLPKPGYPGELEKARELEDLLSVSAFEGNRVDILINGDQIFPPMLEAIRTAEFEICLETFIYASGDIARRFAEALGAAARRGVQTYVLLDWWGSQNIGESMVEGMRSDGVHVRYFNPLRWWQIHRMNFRTHRKILLVDRRVAFTGGVGIADVWQGDARSPAEWHDFHYRFTGPVVVNFLRAFREVWSEVPESDPLKASRQPKRESGEGRLVAQVLMSSPRVGSEKVYSAFRHALVTARESLLLTTAYFVPDKEIVDNMLAAVERGVDFQVLVPGQHIDYQVVGYASRAVWGRLLKGGVSIHVYEPTMLHAKAMVVDDQWLLLGSANFDNRSFALNDELNVNIFDSQLALEHRRIFEMDKQRSHPMTYREWRKRGWGARIKESFGDLFRNHL